MIFFFFKGDGYMQPAADVFFYSLALEMNRRVWSHIYSCRNNRYMREYFCWLSETIGAATKPCISEAPQHYEWENHTYGEEYFQYPVPICCLLSIPAVTCYRRIKNWSDLMLLKVAIYMPKKKKNVNCFHWFRQTKCIVRRSEMLTMYSTYSMYEGFKLLNPVT